MPSAVSCRLARGWLPALASIALVGGCGRHDAAGDLAAASEKRTAKKLSVIAARLEPWAQTVRVQGSLLADEDAVIGSKIAGRVETVHVDLGSIVRQGDALVVLDAQELQLRVEQANSQLGQACAAIGLTPEDDEAHLDLEKASPVMLEQALVDEAKAAVARADRLIPTRAMTEGEYDTVVAQLKTAQARYQSALNSVREQVALIGVRRAELALARQQLADARITAPFDALVNARHVSPGAYVQVGQAVVALVRIDRLRFTAGVPESRAGAIQVGQHLDIRLAGRDEPIAANISRVSPTVLQTSRSVRIEADVANADLELQAGLFAEAVIVVDSTATSLTVPASAVIQFAGVQKVWAVNDGTASQQTVRIGRREGGRVEILDGLAPGAIVVTNAAEGYDGPVIAIQTPSDGVLRAESPEPETTTLRSVILRSSEETSQPLRRTSG